MIDPPIVLALILFLVPPAFFAGVARSPLAPYRVVFGLVVIALLLFASARPAKAADDPRVPEAAAMYRRLVDAAVTDYWNGEGSSAQLAAQLHQESIWRKRAASPVGAMGLAQFMPSTAEWMARQFPRELGMFDPWDPAQAIRAAALYDRYLFDRVTGASACDRWAFALSAYNGGLGWVRRDKNRASATGADPARWFGHVELTSARATWARVENRGYVARILHVLTPLYIDAGWTGPAVCP